MFTKKISWLRGPVIALAIAVGGCSPGGPEALMRGDKLLRDGKNAEAVQLIEQAVEQMPANARAWNHLGLAYHAAGNPVEARKAYAHALQIDRNYADPHYNLG